MMLAGLVLCRNLRRPVGLVLRRDHVLLSRFDLRRLVL